MQPSASRTAAQRTLVTILLSAVVGWGLFVLAIYTDIVVESGLTPEQHRKMMDHQSEMREKRKAWREEMDRDWKRGRGSKDGKDSR
mgnify:CR=1 FL=1